MKRVALVVLVVGLLAALGTVWWVNRRLSTPFGTFPADGVFVEIPPGATLGSITSRLLAAGVVHDGVTFRLAARLEGATRSLQAGEYYFDRAATPREVVARLRSGDVYTRPVTFPEGLTIAEANNELTFLATGMYGHPLLKQHGAPIRLVVPWKYGFKSIKSIVRIELTDQRPATFWNTLAAHEYDFLANVEPDIPHPRWSQRTERMLGTGETYPTHRYNGYGKWVAQLYANR